jgi:hypothetical protein
MFQKQRDKQKYLKNFCHLARWGLGGFLFRQIYKVLKTL